MARTMILVNKGLLGGGFTSIFKDFYGGLIICLLLFASIEIAAAQRGRRREQGHRERRREQGHAVIHPESGFENHFDDLESGQNGETQTHIVNQTDSEGDSDNDETEVNKARATRKAHRHSIGDWGY